MVTWLTEWTRPQQVWLLLPSSLLQCWVEFVSSNALHDSRHPRACDTYGWGGVTAIWALQAAAQPSCYFRAFERRKNPTNTKENWWPKRSTLGPAETQSLGWHGADVAPEGLGPKQMDWNNLCLLVSEPGITVVLAIKTYSRSFWRLNVVGWIPPHSSIYYWQHSS